MADKFSSFSDAVDAPSRNVFLITLSDTVEINPMPKAIRADTAGVIVFRTVDSTADVTMSVGAGETLPFRVQFIRATGTTSGIVIHGLA
jgi:hypothetical protein